MRRAASPADVFHAQLKMAGHHTVVMEYRFAAHHVGMGKGLRERLLRAGMQDWRFDFCWLVPKVAIELDGGGYVNGAHGRGKHMESDCAKLSTSVSLGWRVLRITPAHVRSGMALRWAELTLAGGREPLPTRWQADHVS